MMKKIFRIAFWTLCALVFFRAGYVSAASFYLEPSSGNLIKGCAAQIKVKMSTGAQSSNGAQVYVGYTNLGGGTISIGGSGLFSTYGTPPGTPAGEVGLFGYGGIVSGDGRDYATVNVRSNVNGPLNLSIRFDDSDITSKIASHPTSENILTGVAGGSYTVIDGYCETQPPYLTNLNPVPDKPNHPVGQNITFDIRDDSSGLNMATFNVTVKQSGVTLPVNVTQTANGTGDKWYSIVVDPVNNLTPELKVEVTVTASDKAGNNMSRTYQFNDLTCSQLGCLAGGVTAQCNDGIDNDSDGKIDFPEDAGCLDTNDNNEYQSGDFVCSTTPTGIAGGVTAQCSDSIDNDNDGLIDLADPECTSVNVNSEMGVGEQVCPLATTTPVVQISGQQFAIANLRFYLANRAFEIQPNVARLVETLSGAVFTVAADVGVISEQVSAVNLLLGDKSYRLYYDNGLKLYAVDILDLLASGTYNAALTVDYGDSKQAVVPFTVSVLPRGIVTGKDRDGKTSPIAGATVRLEQLSADDYVEVSSVQTDSSGAYGFIVPNGGYRLIFEAVGFRTERTSGFQVNNHIINRSSRVFYSVDLLSDVPLTEKASYVASVAQEQAGKLVDSADDPQVERAAEIGVAPIALGAAVAATLPAISLLNLLSYLRFIFLQPIFLFGYRRRKKWGIIYNSLTKMPVDLAVVRLLDAKSNRIIQSRVTDNEGRYSFFVDPGLYRIEVNKPGFIFPTKALQDFNEDTSFLDLYHGEPVHVDDKYVAISANIPVDPVGVEAKTPRRILIGRWLRGLQRFIASLSIAAGILAVIILPNWWTIGLMVLQVLLYFAFKRLSTPPKPKNWGIVYDKLSKKPVGKAVARLFSKQFNKLVSTEITDNSGRYSFMVGPNEYYVTFEKAGYNKTTSPEIKIKEKNEVVKVDVGMDKISGSPDLDIQVPPTVTRPPSPPAPQPPASPTPPFRGMPQPPSSPSQNISFDN